MHKDHYVQKGYETSPHSIRWSFFGNALHKALLFFVREIRVYNLILYIFFAVVPYLTSFVMSYPIPSKLVAKVKGPLIIYVFGTFLTPLPTMLVIILAFFPINIILPLLTLVMLYNCVSLFAL